MSAAASGVGRIVVVGFASGRIPAEKMGTHKFGLDEIERAYDVFGNAAAHEALKVVITTR